MGKEYEEIILQIKKYKWPISIYLYAVCMENVNDSKCHTSFIRYAQNKRWLVEYIERWTDGYVIKQI